MPAGNLLRERKVDVFLAFQDLPVVVTVAVVPEGCREIGPQAEARGGNGLVGDTTGQLPMPSLQTSVPGSGACGSPVKMMSWKTVPVRRRSHWWSPSDRSAARGSKRRWGLASMHGRLRCTYWAA